MITLKVMQESTLFVTLEPCIMCASSLHQLEVERIVYGANNPRFGGLETVASNAQYDHKHTVKVNRPSSSNFNRPVYEIPNLGGVGSRCGALCRSRLHP